MIVFTEVAPIWFLVESRIEFQLIFEIALEKHTNYAIDNFKIFEKKEDLMSEFKKLVKPPFLVFIDIDNFKESFILLSELKKTNSVVPVCMLSIGIDFKNIEMSRIRGGDGYIQKVLDAELLASRILFFIEKRILENDRSFLILVSE